MGPRLGRRRTYYGPDFGMIPDHNIVTGAGTDNSAAMASLVAAACKTNYGADIVIPASFYGYKFNSTWDLGSPTNDLPVQINLYGEGVGGGAYGYNAVSSPVTALVYGGVGTAISARHYQHGRMENFFLSGQAILALISGGGSTPGARGIVIHGRDKNLNINGGYGSGGRFDKISINNFYVGLQLGWVQADLLGRIPLVFSGGGSPTRVAAGYAQSNVGVNGGGITSIVITDGGAGYSSAPTITIPAINSGTQATVTTASVTLTSGAVNNSVTVNAAGTNYWVSPSTDSNNDTMIFDHIQINNCLTGVKVCNNQSLANIFNSLGGGQCPTLFDMTQGGDFIFNNLFGSACGGACPAIAARPTPDLTNDWMLKFGAGGVNASGVTISGFRPETSNQLIKMTTSSLNVTITGFEESAPSLTGTPASLISMSGGVLKFVGGDIQSAASGQSANVIAALTGAGGNKSVIQFVGTVLPATDPSAVVSVDANSYYSFFECFGSGYAPLINCTNATVWENFPPQTLTDAATITWNANLGTTAKVTLGGNRTLALPTNLQVGGQYILQVTQDATGSRSLGYASGFKWPGGIVPALTTAANAVDLLSFVSIDGTNLLGIPQKAFA